MMKSDECFGRKKNCDRLTIIEDILGLADRSSVFASFLTVTGKLKYLHLYIFYISYSEKAIWQMILSHT